MDTFEIERRKIALEDLYVGTGTVKQMIDGVEVLLTKINAANLPFDSVKTLKQRLDEFSTLWNNIKPDLVILKKIHTELDKLKNIEKELVALKDLLSNVPDIKKLLADIDAVKKVGGSLDNIKKLLVDIDEIKKVSADLDEIKKVSTNIDGLKNIVLELDNIKKLLVDIDEIKKVSADLDEIKKVSTNIASVLSVSSELPNIKKLLVDIDEIKKVSADLDEIKKVATDLASIINVESELVTIKKLLADIDAVKKIGNDIDAVKKVATDLVSVVKVSTEIDNINKLLTNVGAVKKVADDLDTIKKVVADYDSVKKVAIDLDAIKKVFTDLVSVNSVATDIDAVKKVATDLVSIKQVVDKINGLQKALDALNKLKNLDELTVDKLLVKDTLKVEGSHTIVDSDDFDVSNGIIRLSFDRKEKHRKKIHWTTRTEKEFKGIDLLKFKSNKNFLKSVNDSQDILESFSLILHNETFPAPFGKVYFFVLSGGVTSKTGNYKDGIYIYSLNQKFGVQLQTSQAQIIEKGVWTEIPFRQAASISQHKSCFFLDKLFILGGRDSTGSEVSSVYITDSQFSSVDFTRQKKALLPKNYAYDINLFNILVINTTKTISYHILVVFFSPDYIFATTDAVNWTNVTGRMLRTSPLVKFGKYRTIVRHFSDCFMFYTVPGGEGRLGVLKASEIDVHTWTHFAYLDKDIRLDENKCSAASNLSEIFVYNVLKNGVKGTISSSVGAIWNFYPQTTDTGVICGSDSDIVHIKGADIKISSDGVNFTNGTTFHAYGTDSLRVGDTEHLGGFYVFKDKKIVSRLLCYQEGETDFRWMAGNQQIGTTFYNAPKNNYYSLDEKFPNIIGHGKAVKGSTPFAYLLPPLAHLEKFSFFIRDSRMDYSWEGYGPKAFVELTFHEYIKVYEKSEANKDTWYLDKDGFRRKEFTLVDDTPPGIYGSSGFRYAKPMSVLLKIESLGGSGVLITINDIFEGKRNERGDVYKFDVEYSKAPEEEPQKADFTVE